jgi:hypothetical protein
MQKSRRTCQVLGQQFLAKKLVERDIHGVGRPSLAAGHSQPASCQALQKLCPARRQEYQTLQSQDQLGAGRQFCVALQQFT